MIERDITYPNIWAYNIIQYDIAEYKWYNIIVTMLRHHIVWKINILCYAMLYDATPYDTMQ